jgi:hypothetical protein
VQGRTEIVVNPQEAFKAHLSSLEKFSDHLKAQGELVKKNATKISDLADRPFPAGNFPEAEHLRMQHIATARDMFTLVDLIDEAVTFSDEVVTTSAASFRGADADAAAGYQRVHSRYEKWQAKLDAIGLGNHNSQGYDGSQGAYQGGPV